MDDKNMRINMIKIFGLGIKYANAGITDNDFFYSNIFEGLFDNIDEPATVEQIMRRLDNICNGNNGSQIICIQAYYPEQAVDLVTRKYGLKYNEYKWIN